MNVEYFHLLVLPTLVLMYYLMVHLPEQQRREIKRKLGDAQYIHLAMDKVREKTNIGRVLIMKCNNGTEISRFGSKIEVSGLYQSVQPPFTSQLETYKTFTADGQYVQMLKHVLDNGNQAFFTDDLPYSFLRKVYEQEGVAWSYVFSIGADRDHFYFGSLATNEHKTPFQLNQGLHIELFLNEIRRKYKKLNHTPLKQLKRVLRL